MSSPNSFHLSRLLPLPHQRRPHARTAVSPLRCGDWLQRSSAWLLRWRRALRPTQTPTVTHRPTPPRHAHSLELHCVRPPPETLLLSPTRRPRPHESACLQEAQQCTTRSRPLMRRDGTGTEAPAGPTDTQAVATPKSQGKRFVSQLIFHSRNHLHRRASASLQSKPT
jgi:hypothetical protein